MTPLAQLLEDNWREIKPRLRLGYVRKNDLVHRLEKWEDAASGEFGDEQVWTYLAACGYAIAGTDGVARLARILTGQTCTSPMIPRYGWKFCLCHPDETKEQPTLIWPSARLPGVKRPRAGLN